MNNSMFLEAILKIQTAFILYSNENYVSKFQYPSNGHETQVHLYTNHFYYSICLTFESSNALVSRSTTAGLGHFLKDNVSFVCIYVHEMVECKITLIPFIP